MKEADSRIGASVVWSVAGNAFPPFAALLVAPIMAHVLGVEGRGQVASATAPYLLAVAAATVGAPEAVTFFTAQSRQIARRASGLGLWITLAAGATATAAVLVARDALSDSNPDVGNAMLVVSGAIIPMLLVGLLRGTASGLQLWRAVALERIGGAICRVLLIAGFALAGHLTVLTASIGMAFGPALGVVFYLITLSRHRLPDRTEESAALRFRVLFLYGSRMWVGAIAGILLMRIDQVLLSPLASFYELGIYVVAVNVAEVPLFISNAIREVTFASYTKTRNSAQLAKAARLSILGSLGVGAIVSLSMPYWVHAVFGNGFAASSAVALVLSVAVVIGTPGSVAGSGLAGLGRPGSRSVSLTVACIVNIVMLVVLVPSLGAQGAAIATLVGNVVSSNLNIFWLKRQVSDLRWSDFYRVRSDDVKTVFNAARQVGSLRSAAKT